MTPHRSELIRRPRSTRWSVGAHLVAITAAAMIAFAAVAGVVAVRDFHRARDAAVAETAFQARLGAAAVAEGIGQASETLATVAADPSIPAQLPALVTDGAQCPVEIGGVGPFTEAAMHFFRPDGLITCSSAAPEAWRLKGSLGGLPLFASLRTAQGIIPTGLHQDPLTGKTVTGYATLVRDGAGRPLGGIALTFSPASGEATIARSYAGPKTVRFSLVDRDDRLILLSTEAPTLVGSRAKAAVVNGAVGTWRTGFDGVRRLYALRDVTGTRWRVLASVTEETALAEARAHLTQMGLVGAVALIVTLLLGLWLNRRIAGPLRELRRAVEQAGNDVHPAPVAVDGPAELGQVVQAFNAMVEARAASDHRLQHHLMHDATTGLPNRLVFGDRVEQALQRGARSHGTTAVLFVRLERVGDIGRALGAGRAEEALSVAGQRIRDVLRPADTVARHAGDVFAVLCEGIVSPEQAAVVATRVRDAVAMPMLLGEADVSLAATIGIALSDDVADGEELVRRAEHAMSVATQREYGTAFYEQAGRDDASQRLRTEAQLRKALEADQIGVAYQPVVSLDSRRPLAFEALARWTDPERGPIPPAEFIPIAEDSGLIRELGRHVLVEAVRQAAVWRASGHDVEIAVNVSAKQLLASDFPAQVREALETAGLPAEALRLEITETVLMGDVAAEAALHRLKEIGVKLSIDDFGTGFSSLSYLRRFPIDQLKIDRTFIAELEPTSAAAVLVKAIVDMARALDVAIVAEGVETPGQAALLGQLGCEAAQGYLFGRPDAAGRAAETLTHSAPALSLSGASLN